MKFISSILPLLLFFACKSTKTTNNNVIVKETTQEEVVFIELVKGTNSGFEEPLQQVITNQDELTKTWEQVYLNYFDKPKPPRVDFNENQVILIAMGMKTSGGYDTQIRSINLSNENYTVEVIETSPGKGCMTTEAITYPFQLVQIKKPKGKTTFNITQKVIDCKSE